MITPTPGHINRKRSLWPADTTSAHTILLEVVEMSCKIIYVRKPTTSTGNPLPPAYRQLTV